MTYRFLVSAATIHRTDAYRSRLAAGRSPGRRLADRLSRAVLDKGSTEDFLDTLVNTKHPTIFAEQAIRGDGSDWTRDELSILGDVSIAVPVTVYDDGRHSDPGVHEVPFDATLLFVPGALLENGRGETPADWPAVTRRGKLDRDAYFNLYERRLLPPLLHASDTAEQRGKRAIVTVPGIGCGQFAGPFRGRLGQYLGDALERLLIQHAGRFPGIAALYYDPYAECDVETTEIGGVSFRIRPLTRDGGGRPQLCEPARYGEDGDDFRDCELASVVAWDHVSWPGNDFYAGARTTDDGVKAAATDAMWRLTGVKGRYDAERARYTPPPPYESWGELVTGRELGLVVRGNVRVLPPGEAPAPGRYPLPEGY